MFKVTKGPNFDASIDPTDPALSLIGPIVEASATELSLQIDAFVRKAIRKAIPDMSLDLFVESHSPFPGLDMNMELITAKRRRITVLFKDNMLGQAVFETKYTKDGEGWVITHEMSEVII